MRSGGESERGAAMLIVLLILVASTAIGVLASFSTSQEIKSAGNIRQAAQAQYLAEMGVMTSFEAYVDQQSLVDRDLDGQVADGSVGEYQFYLQDQIEDNGRWPVDPFATTAPLVPGSLGFVQQRADYEVRYNDGYLDASLVPRERINQLRRRVRVSGTAALSRESLADPGYYGRTRTQQGLLATFSVQAELQ